MQNEREPKREPAVAAMLESIRSGTFPWVAARAAGVPDEVFRGWMAAP
jgi:hypothetical protein